MVLFRALSSPLVLGAPARSTVKRNETESVDLRSHSVLSVRLYKRLSLPALCVLESPFGRLGWFNCLEQRRYLLPVCNCGSKNLRKRWSILNELQVPVEDEVERKEDCKLRRGKTDRIRNAAISLRQFGNRWGWKMLESEKLLES